MRDRPCPVDVYLMPGEVFAGHAGHRVRTLLGSCVSIILWHPERRVGAMSHFMLSGQPHRPGRRALDGRYGEDAMLLMLDALHAHRVSPVECKGKLFGGASMLTHPMGAGMEVGRRNGEDARRLLQAHGIELAAESLFGHGHRQLVFDVHSGDVWSRQVALAHPAAEVLQ